MNTPITKETIEQLKEILANAPEGATHINCYISYWKVEDRDAFEWDSAKQRWRLISSDAEELRELGDMRLIVSLFEDNARLKGDLDAKYEQAGICNAEHQELLARVNRLELYYSEHERLKTDLNKALHPNGDEPENPLFCDLVGYVVNDLKSKSISTAQEILKMSTSIHRGHNSYADVVFTRAIKGYIDNLRQPAEHCSKGGNEIVGP